LKEGEFKHLFEEDLKKKVDLLSEDCIIETDFEMLIPEDYVTNISERLNLYSRLDNIDEEIELANFIKEMEDRFGPIPNEVQSLFETVRTRWLAEKLGIERLMLKNNTLKAFFIDPENAAFYNSPIFGKILNYIKGNHNRCKLKEVKNKPLLVVDDIKKVEEVKTIFITIMENT
jgi:transcription-repair coupling factor (superfamily II helicase)